MRRFIGEVDGLAADPADSLGAEDLEAGGFKGATVAGGTVCSGCYHGVLLSE